VTFEGKTAVIIGGGSGIGLCTARKFVEAGGTVILGGRSAARLEVALNWLGAPARAMTVDTTDRRSLARFFQRVPALDHLFVTAASYSMGPIDQIDDATAESPFRSKFWGQYYAVREALPRLSKDGSVTLMSGAAGARPPKGAAAYAACNSAIEALGRALAVELAPVRVNSVSPGTIDGALWQSRPAEVRAAAFELYSQLSLVRRPGSEEEVADAVVFLMGNRFMTGSTLYVDGGYVLP
jgi:NAD(P)-dependent dehydrogenase (short-subunit alcohol dehydrogenase family)